MSGVNCLNPWDPQSKRLYQIDGSYSALQAMSCGGGRCDGIVYAIQGNAVDRATEQCGKGWCEDVSPTLNTQDRHAVCYAIYDARGNGEGYVVPKITADHENRITDYTSVVIIDHSRRHNYQPIDVVPTMEAHMGTGGGNVPLILMEINK